MRLSFVQFPEGPEFRFQANMPKAKYEYFDFHSECKNMRWDRISVLLAKLEEDLLRRG